MKALLLLLLSCGSEPASIEVADPLLIQDVEARVLPARALDADREPLLEVPVTAESSTAPEVLRVGSDGRVQCAGNGVAEVMLAAGKIARTVQVECLLIQEVRMPGQTRTVVAAGDGTATPLLIEVLGVGGTALELDSVPLEVSAADPTVARVVHDEAGVRVVGVTPGSTEVTARVGNREGTTVVLVGRQVLERVDMSIPDGETLGLPIEKGSYRIHVTSDPDVEVVVNGGRCSDSPRSSEHNLDCTLDASGTIRVENPSTFGLGATAIVSVKAVRYPNVSVAAP